MDERRHSDATHASTSNRPTIRRGLLLLLIYSAIIALISLYPARFLTTAHSDGFYWFGAPITSPRAFLDDGLNVLMYVPLGMLAVLLLARRGNAILAAVLIGSVMSGAMEYMQRWIPGRFSNLTDLVTNSLGASLGAGIGFLLIGSSLHAWLNHAWLNKDI